MSEQRPPHGAPAFPPPPSTYGSSVATPPGSGPPRPLPPSSQAWSFPHAEATPYHLMLRTWTYAWWKPMVGIVIGVLWFILGAALVFALTAAVWSSFQDGRWLQNFTASFDPTVSPKVLLGTNLALASLIPATWFVMRYTHRMRPRWLTSVVPRMRWSFFFACLGIAVVALFAQIIVASVIPSGGSGDDGLSGSLNAFTTTTAVSAAVVLLTTPLQAVGEEYLFRGYLLMAVGSLFGNKWIAIVVTSVIFALAHGGQNVPLFLDRLAFGLIAAWLVTRTGGLEAGIALHIVNNFLAFGLALAYGDLTSTLTITESSWWQIPTTVVQSVVFTGLVVLLARRMGLQRTTRPPHDEAEGTSGPAVATA